MGIRNTACRVALVASALIGTTALADTLTVTKNGSGTGTVTSNGGTINCGATCIGTFANNAPVTLTAFPTAGSQFTGWLGPCTGTSNCQFNINGATTAIATFAEPPITTAPLDIDGNDACDALTDGLLALRYLFGLTGNPLINNAIGDNADRSSTTQIGNFLVDVRPALDIDGNGKADALTDGLLAIRHLFGLDGTSLVGDAVGSGATRTTAMAIKSYLTGICTPPPENPTLTVTKSGNGVGTVTSNIAGINCGADCNETYNAGTPVILTATPSTGSPASESEFVGWSGACMGTGQCMVTMDTAKSVTAEFALKPNIAFVTSTSHAPASLGGLAGADNICQARAVGAGLSGTYRAWLSSSTVSAMSRLGTASGWVRVDGKPVANSLNDLVEGKMFYPMRINESGDDVLDVRVLTGTQNGVFASTGISCVDYTANVAGFVRTGASAAHGGNWSAFGAMQCSSTAPLYCFGIDRSASVQIAPLPARRIAFVTEAQWPHGAAGITGADALCAAEASSAGLQGTFKAFLATTTGSAASRFDPDGLPWGRVDGALLAPTGTLALNGASWDTAPGVSADGTEYQSNIGVWSGAPNPTTVGTVGSTCSNWTSGGGIAGMGGRAGFSTFNGLMGNDTMIECDSTIYHVVCLQQ